MCQTNMACMSHPGRSFLTRDEKIELLKEYKENLEQETKGVAEKISQLEKED